MKQAIYKHVIILVTLWSVSHNWSGTGLFRPNLLVIEKVTARNLNRITTELLQEMLISACSNHPTFRFLSRDQYEALPDTYPYPASFSAYISFSKVKNQILTQIDLRDFQTQIPQFSISRTDMDSLQAIRRSFQRLSLTITKKIPAQAQIAQFEKESIRVNIGRSFGADETWKWLGLAPSKQKQVFLQTDFCSQEKCWLSTSDTTVSLIDIQGPLQAITGIQIPSNAPSTLRIRRAGIPQTLGKERLLPLTPGHFDLIVNRKLQRSVVLRLGQIVYLDELDGPSKTQWILDIEEKVNG